MSEPQDKGVDPMHGVTLKMMLTDVVELFGFKELFTMTEIRSFDDEYPRVNKILKFVRKAPWAKDKIEKIYRGNIEKIAANKKQQKRNFKAK
ncbi:MAG: DNA-binding protein VF530 [Halobacteriovoraceae bacterium]|nr:DNA-binding protein VF530 [Halobacteriovoraceae bacterium]MBT5093872.1 DNA-binding protein VF530 [Halobacteriovoraceae bacterium]